jgi:hypothetical protein
VSYLLPSLCFWYQFFSSWKHFKRFKGIGYVYNLESVSLHWVNGAPFSKLKRNQEGVSYFHWYAYDDHLSFGTILIDKQKLLIMHIFSVWTSIVGNEMADHLARMESECLFIGPEPASRIWTGIAKKAVRDWTNRNHKHWESVTGLKQVEGLIQGSSARRMKDMLKLNRDQWRWVLELFIGQCHQKDTFSNCDWQKTLLIKGA